jgi:hypothetical protein
MNYFDLFIILIFFVKLVFIILAVYRLYIKTRKPQDKKLLKTVEFWRHRVEFLFITLMSILLIYLFNPRANNINMINGETKLLLFLFGFVILLTENWSSFIHESILFKNFQSILN